MPLIKPEYLKNFKQLEDIRISMLRSRNGSPRWLKMMGCALASFGLTAFAGFLMEYFDVRLFGLKNPYDWTVIFAGAVAVLVVLVVYLIDKNETWDDVLLKKLTAYKPVNTIAYNNLRDDVKDKHDLDWASLEAFLAFEKEALYQPVTVKQSVKNFIERTI